METTTNNWIKKITLMSLVLLGMFSADSAKAQIAHESRSRAQAHQRAALQLLFTSPNNQRYIWYLQNEISQIQKRLAELDLFARKLILNRQWTEQKRLNYHSQERALRHRLLTFHQALRAY